MKGRLSAPAQGMEAQAALPGAMFFAYETKSESRVLLRCCQNQEQNLLRVMPRILSLVAEVTNVRRVCKPAEIQPRWRS
jgi:hypothetical protein